MHTFVPDTLATITFNLDLTQPHHKECNPNHGKEWYPEEIGIVIRVSTVAKSCFPRKLTLGQGTRVSASSSGCGLLPMAGEV